MPPFCGGSRETRSDKIGSERRAWQRTLNGESVEPAGVPCSGTRAAQVLPTTCLSATGHAVTMCAAERFLSGPYSGYVLPGSRIGAASASRAAPRPRDVGAPGEGTQRHAPSLSRFEGRTRGRGNSSDGGTPQSLGYSNRVSQAVHGGARTRARPAAPGAGGFDGRPEGRSRRGSRRHGRRTTCRRTRRRRRGATRPTRPASGRGWRRSTPR
jgi:hypothetical protein